MMQVTYDGKKISCLTGEIKCEQFCGSPTIYPIDDQHFLLSLFYPTLFRIDDSGEIKRLEEIKTTVLTTSGIVYKYVKSGH